VGESSAAGLEDCIGIYATALEKPESFASCSLSPRERVRVRGKVCPLFRWLQFKLNRSKGVFKSLLEPHVSFARAQKNAGMIRFIAIGPANRALRRFEKLQSPALFP
jgi:hypothetical protein